MNIFLYLLVATILTENLTEIVVKSTIAFKPRNFLILRSKFFEELLTCGYCFSFWASVLVNTSFTLLEVQLNLFNLPTLPNLIIMILLVHRLSNMLHGAIDRYFDTRKDIRYNREN